jgi:twitching motility protein PilI
MAAGDSRELILLLQEIERRSLEHAAGLRQEDDVTNVWEGVLFSVGGERFATPLNEVKEILNFPSVITSVPGARKWVRGVANVRGNLLPILDLQVFLGGKSITVGRRTRVLVVDHDGLFAGLMIGELLGMKHFDVDSYQQNSDPKQAITKYTDGFFSLEGEQWPVFSMRALVEDPAFQVAAA